MSTQRPEPEPHADPHALMERTFMDEYLRERGHSLNRLHELSEGEARQLMTEASCFASARLSEIEARAHFVEEVHGVAPSL